MKATIAPALASLMLLGGQGHAAPAEGRRGYVPTPRGASTSPADAPISPIIYVNRCRGGCVFTKAPVSNAIRNETIIGPQPIGATVTLSEYGHDEASWDRTLACVREVYAPFGVQIVTEDPGAVPHHEAVLAGRAEELGLSGVRGIAQLDAETCRPLDNVISFTFANSLPPSSHDLCWTLAQESAHAFGLDHEYECTDPMTYIPDACDRQKFFRNVDAPCGTVAPTTCLCGAATQNSYQRLLAIHGPGTAVIAPPVVDITAPADGATGLARGFSIISKVIDPRGVHHIDVLVNGWTWASVPPRFQDTSSYIFELPDGVPDGVMDLEVRGYGDTGAMGSDHVTVTRGAPCTSADACLASQACEEGRCAWDPSRGVGEACEVAQQCASNHCASVGGAQICTEACVGGAACTEGLECIAPADGEPGLCGPPAADAGGCCSTGGGRLGDLGLGSALGLLLVRRRRGRRRRG